MTLLVVCTWMSAFAAHAAHRPVPPGGGFDFSGAWRCEGSFRGGTVHKSVFQGRLAVGGAWLELDETDRTPSTGYAAKYVIGYDAHRKRFVEFDASNSGANAYYGKDCWVDGVLTMVSEPLDDPTLPYARDRFIYTVKGAYRFLIDWQVVKPGASEWLQGDHLECARTTRRRKSKG